MLKVGTRASKLATTQSAWVARQLTAAKEFELIHISTQGDVDRTSLLTQIGGTGVFVSAVREALLQGEVDVVIHSLKDLPTAPAAGICLAAVPVREDPRDALIAPKYSSLEELPAGAKVGTGSPRRASQLRLLRPDLEILPIRGNIDTRLGFAKSGELDAVILASAGLRRLGLEAEITAEFDPWQYLPAPAQGALAVEVRSDLDPDSQLAVALRHLDHAPTRAAAVIERAILRELEAGCSAPVAAFAQLEPQVDPGKYLAKVKAGVYGTETQIVQEMSAELDLGAELKLGSSQDIAASTAYALGAQLAQNMLAAGARGLLAN